MNTQMKPRNWTLRNVLSPESLSIPLIGEYIKKLPQQSKYGKDYVIIGPWDIGDVQSHGSSEVRQTDYKLGNLPLHRLWSLSFTNLREREKKEKKEGECVSHQSWPDRCDSFLTVRVWEMNYQKSQLIPIKVLLQSNSDIFKHISPWLRKWK